MSMLNRSAARTGTVNFFYYQNQYNLSQPLPHLQQHAYNTPVEQSQRKFYAGKAEK